MEIQRKHSKSVLLVDDESDIREPIREILRMNYGSDLLVIEAKDGMDGLYKIQNQKFNCIVTDLNMPRMTGQQLIAALKKSQFNRETPVIIMTGFPDKSLFEKHDFLTMLEKPVSLKVLLENIKEQMGLGRGQNQKSAQLIEILVELMQKVFKVMYSLDFKPRRPQAKAAGENFEGAVFCAFSVRNGKSFTDFVLSFHQDISSYFGKTNDPVSKYVNEVIENLVAVLRKGEYKEAVLNLSEWSTAKQPGPILREWTPRGGVRVTATSTVGKIDCFVLN